MYRAEITSDTDPEAAMNVVRWIVGVMSVGMVLATGVFAVVGPLEPDADAGVWLLVIGAVGIGSFGCWTIVSRVMLATLRKRWSGRSDPEAAGRELVQPFVTRAVVGAACAEGPGLLAAVVYFLTGNLLSVAAIVVALYALIGFYPRADSYGRFVASVIGSDTEPA